MQLVEEEAAQASIYSDTPEAIEEFRRTVARKILRRIENDLWESIPSGKEKPMSNLKRKIERLERAANPPDPFPFDAIIYRVMRRHPETGKPIVVETWSEIINDEDKTTGGQLPLTDSNASQNATE